MRTIKKALRDQLRARLAAIPPDVLAERSARACERVCSLPEYRNAGVIMIFLSLPREVDTAPLALRAWEDGKRLLAPRVSWEQRRMVPVEIRSLTHGLAETQFGLREPAEGAVFPVEEIDLVLVPGLGFDPFGNRLGRGRGFYDRFLSQEAFRGVSCGLALEEQVVSQIPAGPGDVSVDMLVTDEQVRRFRT